MYKAKPYSDDELALIIQAIYRTPSVNTRDFWMYCANPSLTKFNSSELTGKWCIFRPKSQIDELWEVIKEQVNAKKLLLAKCSTLRGELHTPNRPYVICVYTDNWKDEAQTQAALLALRDAGIRGTLKYKRCLDTFAGTSGDAEFYRISKDSEQYPYP